MRRKEKSKEGKGWEVKGNKIMSLKCIVLSFSSTRVYPYIPKNLSLDMMTTEMMMMAITYHFIHPPTNSRRMEIERKGKEKCICCTSDIASTSFHLEDMSK